MTETGVEPWQALMIGDTEYDLEMAVNASVSALGMTYGVHAHEGLLKHNLLACLDRITDIPAWLGKCSANGIS